MKTLYRENKELCQKVDEYRTMIDTMHVELEELIAFREEYIRYYNEHGSGEGWDPSEFAALSDSDLIADIKESDFPENRTMSDCPELVHGQ